MSTEEEDRIAEEYAQWLGTERQRLLAIDRLHGNDEYKPSFKERWELFWNTTFLGMLLITIFTVVISVLIIIGCQLLFLGI